VVLLVRLVLLYSTNTNTTGASRTTSTTIDYIALILVLGTSQPMRFQETMVPKPDGEFGWQGPKTCRWCKPKSTSTANNTNPSASATAATATHSNTSANTTTSTAITCESVVQPLAKDFEKRLNRFTDMCLRRPKLLSRSACMLADVPRPVMLTYAAP
jgi:hypothetical protein